MRELVITKTTRSVRVSKEVEGRLKELGVYGRVRFMKKERVSCPKSDEKVSPLYCLLCEYFRRRVKGRIYCEYP